MLGKSNIARTDQESKQIHHDQHHNNFTSVQPSKHPLDLSGRNRNFSLNDLAPSPIRSSKLKESLRQQSADHSIKEAKKLRMRVEQLESENMTLHKLIIEYEQEMKVWQDKAARLNEQLISYENNELAARPTLNHSLNSSPLRDQELKQYKNQIILLQEANKLSNRKIADLNTELEKGRRELLRFNQVELLFSRLQTDYQDAQRRLEREQIIGRQNLSYIQELEQQLQYMSKQIPHRIATIEKEKNEVAERERRQFAEDIQHLGKEIAQNNRKLQEEALLKQKLHQQNRDLRQEIERLIESKSNASGELQQLYEEIIRLKQKNYEDSKNQQQENSIRQRQYNTQITSFAFQINNLKNQNQKLSQDLVIKTSYIEKLENSIESLNQESKQRNKLEEENNFHARSEIFKEQQKNDIYREQIRRLKQIIENMEKEMDEAETSHLNQLKIVRQEAERHAANIQRRIDAANTNHQREKAQLTQRKQSLQSQIHELSKLIHEQEGHIQATHTRYCTEIDKIMAQNVSLRRTLQQIEKYHLQERQQLDSKVKECKEYTYTVSKLQGQIQQLTIQLHHQSAINAENQQQRIAYQQQCELANDKILEIAKKIKDYEDEIQHLAKQNEKWKAYRLSEEDQARRETRKYKKKVEELQLLLQQETQNNAIGDLEIFQKTIESLKQEILQQEIQSKKQLQVQQMKLSQAIDEMEDEMRRILKECECKITQKQVEINQLQNKVKQLTTINNELTSINEELKILQKQSSAAFQQAGDLNDKLKKELLAVRNDTIRLQTVIKKQQSENLAMKYSSETQKEIRSRYDKDMEDKVTQIQRLKLQVAEVSDDLQRKTLAFKRQIQGLELAVKNKQDEIREAIQRNSYLESMTDTFKAENKRFKQIIQNEKNSKQALQNKIDQLSTQLNAEQQKTNRIREQKSQKNLQYQSDAREWKQKWEVCIKQNRRLETKLSQLGKDQQTKQNQVDQLIKQISKMKSQLQDAKQKCQWLEERLNQSSRQGLHLKNIKEDIAQYQQKETNYQNLIESQKQKIQVLIKDQGEKMQEIQILLSKIQKLQIDLKLSLSQVEQANRSKAKRVQCYQNICTLKLTSSVSSRLTFDGDEQLFLRIICEYLSTFSSRLSEAIDEIGKKQKTILQLGEEKENFSNKYQKYKAVAMEYKLHREAQKQLVRHTYRFNDEIINHCQHIIRGDTK